MSLKSELVEKAKEKGILRKSNKYIVDRELYTLSEFLSIYANKLVADTSHMLEYLNLNLTGNPLKAYWKDILTHMPMSKVEAQGEEEEKILESYVWFVDIMSKNSEFVYCKNKKELLPYNPEAIYSTLSKDVAGVFKNTKQLCRVEFSPYTLNKTEVVEDGVLSYVWVNSHIPPKWRFAKIENPQIPKQVDALLNHLFIDEYTKDYILDWLYRVIVTKNEVALILNSSKGCGKNIFSFVTKALVGRDYQSDAPKSLFKGYFNSVLKEHRVIFLDELKIDKNAHSELKKISNTYQNIEEKGLDASKSIETFNSFLIANNDVKDCYIEHNDRRFSVPDITTEKLEVSMSPKEIAALVLELEDEDSPVVAEFGHYLLNRGEKLGDTFTLVKSKKFEKLVKSSLTLWQQAIFKVVMFGFKTQSSTVVQQQIKKHSKKGIYSIDRIEDFVKNFTYEGYPLGIVVLEEDDWSIEVDPHWWAEEYKQEDNKNLI